MNSKSSLLASPRAAGAATVTRTSSAFTPRMIKWKGMVDKSRTKVSAETLKSSPKE